MSKLTKIMKGSNAKQREIELRQYAVDLGVSTHLLVDSVTGQTNEPELIERIQKVEHHQANLQATYWASTVAFIGIAWSIIYTFFIYPPRYIINSEDLLLKKDIKSNYAELELHFVLNNQNAGTGEISKPILVVSSKTGASFTIPPDTMQQTGISREGNTSITQYNDTGRTLRVGEYGRIDEYIFYRVGSYPQIVNADKIIQLLNEKDLEFKINGFPYGELKILRIEDGNL